MVAEIHTDASCTLKRSGVGVVVLVEGQPVACLSQALDACASHLAERKALLLGLELDAYLGVQDVTVRTDDQGMVYLLDPDPDRDPLQMRGRQLSLRKRYKRRAKRFEACRVALLPLRVAFAVLKGLLSVLKH